MLQLMCVRVERHAAAPTPSVAWRPLARMAGERGINGSHSSECMRTRPGSHGCQHGQDGAYCRGEVEGRRLPLGWGAPALRCPPYWHPTPVPTFEPRLALDVPPALLSPAQRPFSSPSFTRLHCTPLQDHPALDRQIAHGMLLLRRQAQVACAAANGASRRIVVRVRPPICAVRAAGTLLLWHGSQSPGRGFPADRSRACMHDARIAGSPGAMGGPRADAGRQEERSPG